MPVILAIDSSTEACSCALLIDGDVTEDFEHAPRRHAARLLPMISALMKDQGLTFQELDAVAFGRGPGSFTGLRIGAGVAQGIAFGAALPVVPVSTLAAMAMEAWEQSDHRVIFSCLDARIGEVYWGLYRIINGTAVLDGQEAVTAPAAISAPRPVDEVIFGAGDGMNYFDEMSADLRAVIQDYSISVTPRAKQIAKLAGTYFAEGKVISAAEISPTYLRNKVV